MGTRFRDSGETIYRFATEFLVRCPRCQRRASVIPLPGHEPRLFAPRRVVCAQCGYTKDWHGKTACMGRATDWYFGLPLWLQTPCCGQILWAYNKDHLDFLEAYVRADLRERVPNKNSSVASRLPTWIKDAHHRAEVLCSIERLRRKLK
jgi:hypothetical protein